MKAILAAMGGWLALDGGGSIIMYWKKPAHDGRTQDWKHDHWLRLARVGIGIALILWSRKYDAD
jgi:hypothetical protein